MARTDMLSTNVSPRFSLQGDECRSTEHLTALVLIGDLALFANNWGYVQAPAHPVCRFVDTPNTVAITERQHARPPIAAAGMRSRLEGEQLRLRERRNQIVQYRLSRSAAYILFKELVCSHWGPSTQTTTPIRDEDVIEMKNAQADEFLEGVYRLDALDETQLATFKVFDHVERLLHEGAFDVCNTLIERIDVTRLSSSLMRSFLTITLAAKDSLPSRTKLLGRIESEMTRIRGSEITRRLLSRLA
jgi:hypothetical protein